MWSIILVFAFSGESSFCAGRSDDGADSIHCQVSNLSFKPAALCLQAYARPSYCLVVLPSINLGSNVCESRYFSSRNCPLSNLSATHPSSSRPVAPLSQRPEVGGAVHRENGSPLRRLGSADILLARLAISSILASVALLQVGNAGAHSK